MAGVDEMLPMDYVRPLAGGGTVPLSICNSGTSTFGSICNTGSETYGADCYPQGYTTDGARCNSGSATGFGICSLYGNETM